MEDGFERVIWVYRCVDVIAANASRLPFLFRQGHEEDGEVVAVRDPLLHRLNKRPNPYETARQFRYRLSCQLLLSKKGVFVEIVRDGSGRVSELHLLPPDRTDPLPHPDRFVEGYRLTFADGGWEDLPADRVLWIRKPHPIDPYSGSIPLEAAGLTVDLDYYARLFNRNFLINDGRPGGLIAVKGELSDEDAAELKRRFQGGPANAGRATVIEADDVAWVDTATSPRDAQYVQALTGTKSDIMLAFGVPESVLGNASGRTYDNAGAEEMIFWRTTMRDHLDLLEGSLELVSQAGDEDDVWLRHDVSGIAVLRRDQREREAKALQDFQAGVITADEYRELTGKSPLDVPGSRVLWLPGGKVPVAANEEDQEAAAALAPAGQGAGLGMPPVAEVPTDPEATDVSLGLGAGGTQANYDRAASARFEADNYDGVFGLSNAWKALAMPGDLSSDELLRVLEALDAGT